MPCGGGNQAEWESAEPITAPGNEWWPAGSPRTDGDCGGQGAGNCMCMGKWKNYPLFRACILTMSCFTAVQCHVWSGSRGGRSVFRAKYDHILSQSWYCQHVSGHLWHQCLEGLTVEHFRTIIVYIIAYHLNFLMTLYIIVILFISFE